MKLHFSLSTVRIWIGMAALTFFVNPVTAQSPSNPTWQDLKQSGANYNDVKAAFLRQNESRLPRAFRELTKEVSRPERKSDKFERELEGIVQFQRWSEFVEPRVAESNGDLSVINEGNVRALAQQTNLLQSRAATWQLVGPRNTATNGGNGRVNGIKVHPTNSNILFASTPAGGLWKSINGGTSWTAITDAIAVLGATDVAFDPTNPDIMYLATGDGDAADTRSTGVYKSTDGGNTWVATGLNFTLSQGTTLSKILVHPTNNQILLTAGNTGIRRSTDAGATWTQVSTASIKDLEWKPNNPSVVYAGGYSGSAGVWRSTDNGVTWTKLTATPLPSTGTQRVAIGVSPHDPEYVYALFAKTTTYGFQGMYRSIDGGTTWTQQTTTPNMLGWVASGSDTDGQGWYDLAIAVSPTDKNMVMIGGVNIWKSTDGGVTWTCKAHWSGNGAPYVHADQHDFTFSGSTFYAGNDGGVFKSTDGGTTWTNISSTLSNAQMYGLGLSAGNANLILSGHQDNGTNLTSNGTTWAQVLGGDGMLCFIDRTNDSRMFASIYNGALYRSTNGGASFGSLTTITNGGWVTPWLQDPVSPATIYAAGSEINKSIDNGTNWTTISSFGGTTAFKTMDVAKTNPLCIIAATSASVRKTINGGTSWTTLTGLPTSGILTVHFNVNDANKIYVGVASYQGNSVWYSSDGGATWVNWGTGLPSVPVSCFVTQLGTDGSMYCGTDIGVYYRNNTSTGWTAFTQGMPGIPVRDLEIFYPTQKLRAATYGRGIWESNLEVTVSGFSVVASANPVTGGTVTGTGFFTSGQSVTLTATPNTGWTFVNWTENGVAVSTNATLTFNATANRTLQANFTGGPLPACGNTTLTNCSGTITDGSGALNYDHGLLCTWLIRPTTPPASLTLNFTAFATESGYDFVKVYDGTSSSGILLGSFSGTTIPSRLIASSGAMFIEFISDVDIADAGWAATYTCSSGTLYQLTLNANPIAGGTVLGARAYMSGDSVTVSATANANYTFTNWTDSLTGAIVSNTAIYGFRMTANRKLTANFRISGCAGLMTYTNCNGTIDDGSGANNYNNNLNCTWLIQPSTPTTALLLNFTAFSTEAGFDSVKIYDGTSTNGRFLGGFTGTTLPPRLVATSGALFIQFITDGNTVSTGWSANYSCSNASIYAVTLNANPVAGGTVTGARNYLLNDTVTVVATANWSYRFVNWTDSIGNIVSTNATYGFRVTGNRRLTAHFGIEGCSGLTTYTTCSGTVTDNSSGNYANNLRCTWLIQPSPAATRITLHFTAFATEANYDSVAIYDGNSATGRFLGKFSGTTLPADLVATSGALFIRFTTDGSTVNAGWSADWTCVSSNPTYNLTLNANPVTGGTVSGGGAYPSGQSVRARAIPTTGWNFVNWTENGTMVSLDTAFSVVLTGNRTLTANFVLIGDTLHLVQGWNMVGIYINPTDPLLTNMLASITNQLILMKTVDGRTYMPSTNINTIQNWNVKEGYRIKMTQAADVVLYGRRIDPMTIQIPFTAGWSIIPYVRTNPMLFSTVFAGNAGQIDLAKDNLGQTWVPSLSINNIGNATVNQAYKIKFNTTGALSQPANRRGDDPIENPSSARYFEVSKQPTGEDATIILTQSILKDVLQMGDEVGVFNATGLLCGSVVWKGDNTAIAVKGDDAFTAPQEGMKTGDNYQLHVKRHGFDLPIRLNVVFENANQAHYAADNISRLAKASLPSMPVLPFTEKAFAYPNPVGTELTIQLESDDANAMITLYDVMGNLLQLNTEQRVVGKTQVWKFDTSNLANGAYLYTVKTVHKTHNGTYMIQH